MNRVNGHVLGVKELGERLMRADRPMLGVPRTGADFRTGLSAGRLLPASARGPTSQPSRLPSTSSSKANRAVASADDRHCRGSGRRKSAPRPFVRPEWRARPCRAGIHPRAGGRHNQSRGLREDRLTGIASRSPTSCSEACGELGYIFSI